MEILLSSIFFMIYYIHIEDKALVHHIIRVILYIQGHAWQTYYYITEFFRNSLISMYVVVKETIAEGLVVIAINCNQQAPFQDVNRWLFL